VPRVVDLGEGAVAEDAAQLVPPHEEAAGARRGASLGRGGRGGGRQAGGLRGGVGRRRLDGRHRRVVDGWGSGGD
jgi:hypothetical protein